MLQAGFEPALHGFSVRGLCRGWATAARVSSTFAPLSFAHAARRIRTCNLRNLSPAPLASWATAAGMEWIHHEGHGGHGGTKRTHGAGVVLASVRRVPRSFRAC